MKYLIELPRETRSGRWMSRDGVDEIVAVLHPLRFRPCRNAPVAVRVNRKGEILGGGVVLIARVVEPVVARGRRAADPRQVPAGKDTRTCIDVGLLERADAHGEQFHQLTREVLLRQPAEVGSAIEPDQHRGILGDRDEQITKVAECVLAKQLQLSGDATRVLALLGGEHSSRLEPIESAVDFRVRRGEVVVPEQRHLFLQRPSGMDHAKEPALPRIDDVLGGQKRATRRHTNESRPAD